MASNSDRLEVTAVYARQLINGLEVVNADVNINIKNCQIVALSDSFYRGARLSQPELAVLLDAGSTTRKSPADVFRSLASNIGAPTPTMVNVTASVPTNNASSDCHAAPILEITSEIATVPVPVHYQYVQNDNNLKPAYSLQLKQTWHWYHGHVNLQTGGVEFVNDWAAAARYPVITVGQQSPDNGPIVIVGSAAVVLLNASPLGWHNTSVSKYMMSPLTGGPANANCQSTGKAIGMGEGWSNKFGIVLNMLNKLTVTRDAAVLFALYVAARNSILLANALLLGGVHLYLIWRRFAKRGLGFNAAPGNYVYVFTVLPSCVL
ncbi:hypothetical protein GGF31_002268 [Allomyces arbusculus]|nr:hypothetical protein GGF31_002268 [Allomyces arbusculus]